MVLFFAGLGATYFVYRSVPTAFVPTEDQGYVFIVVQARPGRRSNTPTSIQDQVHKFRKHGA